MTDKCRYKKKSRKVLKGYYVCTRNRKHRVVKNCSVGSIYNRWCYRPRFPKSLFIWIKGWFK